MTRSLRILSALVAMLAALVVLAPSASAALYNCPGTFEVLHNDRIGNMPAAQGPLRGHRAGFGDHGVYRGLSPLRGVPRRLGRVGSASLGGHQLHAGRSRPDGRVRWDSWSRRTPIPISAVSTSHPPSRRVCPGYFEVLHNDRIGTFRIPKGDYRITLLSYRWRGRCLAVRYLQKFLQDYDGVLLRPGTSIPARAPSSAAIAISASDQALRHRGFRTAGARIERRPVEASCHLPRPETTTASGDYGSTGELPGVGQGPELPGSTSSSRSSSTTCLGICPSRGASTRAPPPSPGAAAA